MPKSECLMEQQRLSNSVKNLQELQANEQLWRNQVSSLENLPESSIDALASSSKKRRVESISSSPMEDAPSSNQELWNTSTNNTLDEVLRLIQEQRQKILSLQDEVLQLRRQLVPSVPEKKTNPLAAAGKKVLGLFTKGDFMGRLYHCLVDDNGKLIKNSIKMIEGDLALSDVAKKVSGTKEVQVDGFPKLKRWSSYKDLESGEFVRGTYQESIEPHPGLYK